MTEHPFVQRLPHARIDPIADPETARFVIGEMMADPPRFETIAVALDHEYRGLSIMNLDHPRCGDLDVVFDAADWAIDQSRRRDDVDAVIIGSIRPGGSDELDDLERWLTLDEMCSIAGIELVEWFVVGRRTSFPRTLHGEPHRWAA